MEKFENNTYVMAERLKELRKKKGLSHAKLSQSLREQYEIKISKDALIAYEAPQYHARAGANNGMSVKYLRCLADFYGVSADYLLGLSGCPTSDMEERGVCEYTGLSSAAVIALRGVYLNAHYITQGNGYTEDNPLRLIDVLDDLIKSRTVQRGIDEICAAMVYNCFYEQHPIETDEIAAAYEKLPEGYAIVRGKDLVKYRFDRARTQFDYFVSQMYHKSRRKAAESNPTKEVPHDEA